MKFEKEVFLGKVKGVFASKYPDKTYTEQDYFFTERKKSIQVNLDGIEGERHYGYSFESDSRMKNLYEKGTKVRFSRQWLAVSEFELEEIRKNLDIKDYISPEHIGANILIDTVKHLSKLPMMSHLVFSKSESLIYKDPSNVVLVSYAEVKPCTIAATAISNDLKSESVKSQFVKCSSDLRGLAGWIEKGGNIQEGDSVFLLTPKGY